MSNINFLAESLRNKEAMKKFVHVRNAHIDKEEEIFQMLIASGAVLRGHFKLESGQHSSIFLGNYDEI